MGISAEKKLNSDSLNIKSNGIIGATCSAAPVFYKNGIDVCFTTRKIFYPGLTMIVAKKAIIKECQSKNALDPSGVFGASSCYGQCEKVASCVYLDSN